MTDQFWKNCSTKRRFMGDSSDDEESFIEDEPEIIKTKTISTQTDFDKYENNNDCDCNIMDIETGLKCKCKCYYCFKTKCENIYGDFICITDTFNVLKKIPNHLTKEDYIFYDKYIKMKKNKYIKLHFEFRKMYSTRIEKNNYII